MLMILRNCGRFYAQSSTLFLRRYSPLMPLRYALPIVLSLFSQIKSEKSGTPLLTLTPSLFLLLQMYPNLTFLKQFLRMKYGKSSIALSSRQPCWCTSFYIVAIQNILNLSLNPDIVCIEHVEVNLMVCCLRSHIVLQYRSLKSILALALHMMPQGFGMISLMMYAQLNLSPHSEKC